jgi:hypothetical protein
MISELATRLSNFTTTTVRLDPKSGQQVVRPGQTIEFDLPSESIVNLDTFALSLVATLTALNGASGAVRRLPNGIELLLEDVSVWCGGIRLDSAGRWFNRRLSLLDANQDRMGDQLSHPLIQREFDSRDYLAGIGTVQIPNRYVTSRLSEGFLGAGVIDTSLMPQLTVCIEFTQLPVCTVSSGLDTIINFTSMGAHNTANYSFEVSDAYAMVEVISAGPIYDQMQQRLMASKGYIPYAFKRFACFQGGQYETSVRFQVNSQSVDRIYASGIDYTPTAGVVLANCGPPSDLAERGLTAELYSTRALRSRVNPGLADGSYTDGPHLWFTLGGVQLPSFHPRCRLVQHHAVRAAQAAPSVQDRAGHVSLVSGLVRHGLPHLLPTVRAQRRPQACQRARHTQHGSRWSAQRGRDERAVLPGTGLGVWVESTAELRVMPSREVQLVP